jgi:DNA-binding NarL/FixJ family response regulator
VPGVQVILFAERADAAQVELALAGGAAGYLLQELPAADLPAAIRLCASGLLYAARNLPALDGAGEAARRAHGLTERELTVTVALARGLSNREIAQELWITEETVKFHLTNVYRKLGVRRRVEAARWAAAQGLLD